MNGREALFYRQLDNSRVKCDLCPQNCFIPNNGIGLCRVRKNVNGRLYSMNYGKIAAYQMDPIEKKPLYHFYPGKRIFSIGSFGCNLSCGYCQNWQIAHGYPQCIETTAENLVNIAENEKDNIGIAYTYNEPFIWYEFIYKIAPILNKAGLKNVLVTNGYIQEKPLEMLLPYIDAMNIDLKGFGESFYQDTCKGTLQPVMNTILKVSQQCHVEITTLIISGVNDTKEEISAISQWLSSINPQIPLHLSRYFPSYKMTSPATAVETLYEAREEAKKYLEYVYIGNVPEADKRTYCPKCKSLLVERSYNTEIVGIHDGKCMTCRYPIRILY